MERNEKIKFIILGLCCAVVIFAVLMADELISKRSKETALQLTEEWYSSNAMLYCQMFAGDGMLLVNDKKEAYFEYTDADGLMGNCVYLHNGYKADLVSGIPMQQTKSPTEIVRDIIAESKGRPVDAYEIAGVMKVEGSDGDTPRAYSFVVSSVEKIMEILDKSTGLAYEIMQSYGIGQDSKVELKVHVYEGVLINNNGVREIVNSGVVGYTSAVLELSVNGVDNLIYDIRTTMTYDKGISIGTKVYEKHPDAEYDEETSKLVAEDVSNSIKESLGIMENIER